MEYRGVEYRIRRTLSPDGWKWSVSVGGREKSGTCSDRNLAIQRAQKLIEELIGDQAPLRRP